MKKFKLISGVIFTFVGFILWVTGATYHSYSRVEMAKAAGAKWLGIMLLLCGVIDLGLLLFSKIYTQKTVQDPTSNQVTMTKCTNCGLMVRNTTKTCPKCKTEIK